MKIYDNTQAMLCALTTKYGVKPEIQALGQARASHFACYSDA